MPNQKFAKDSVTIMTEMVLPNDTNTLNNLMGGRLMHWMDIVAAIAAQKHCNRIVVTASADNISFKEPINLGNVVTLRSQVTRAFNSSMEVFIVAVDQNGKPIEVPLVVPETPEEIEFYEGALRRRQLRLVLAQRMKPEEAVELRSIFNLDKK